ncbi:MAG: hypothetical protein ABSB49_08690 [Polyangia bacterium]|jgi:hypothetical protein
MGPTSSCQRDDHYCPYLNLFFSHSWHASTRDIPLGVAGLFTVSTMLDLGLRWAWDNVGKTSGGMSRADARSLVALANLCF